MVLHRNFSRKNKNNEDEEPQSYEEMKEETFEKYLKRLDRIFSNVSDTSLKIKDKRDLIGKLKSKAKLLIDKH